MSLKNLFTKKRVIWGAVIIVGAGLIGMRLFGSGGAAGNVVTEPARVQNLKATVLATGQVTSTTDLNLSFKASGIVRRINVKVGDVVSEGQVLANLDQRDQVAALTSARGSLAAAQANYRKTLDGSSNEQIQVAQKSLSAAQVSLDTTITQQNILVDNAYRSLLNSSLIAEPSSFIGGNPTISGIYSGTQEGAYNVSVYKSQGGYSFRVSGMEEQQPQLIDDGLPFPLGTRGLYITFPADYSPSNTWTINIPNKSASNYLTNYNAYQSALNNRDTAIASAQAALESAAAQLQLTLAQARPADLQAAQAQILSAQGQIQAAQAAFEATEIRAPANGTVTKIDIKVGELASATSPAIVVQDVGNLYLEANVSEANVPSIKPGQTVDVTFDALGPDRAYAATVSAIDPASTVISGVVNYKVTALLNAVEEIKPGMTANMSILTGEQPGVIAVPQRAVISRDGKKYVRVITDDKAKTFEEREVATGFEADGGLVEIISGIAADQEIVVFIER